MAAAGVPVVPGYDGDDQADERLARESERIGFPVLVKASAGGGGKGMTIVRGAADLAAALGQARRIAQSAFGDDRLVLERYVESPRHVEVQIVGDAHGNVAHVLERECSIQRRFQKVIEEAPAPGLDPALRARIHEAAVTAGHALGYRSAGTVEFIVAPDGSFYFLEVNTRLQVEHPVTEQITGLDLVEIQLRVARGESLPESLASVWANGHAIEARLYAEDPRGEMLPSAGRVLDWAPPEGVRVDAGVEIGTEVGIHYDPMLAKVIAWAPTRDEATDKLARAVARFGVLGLATNRDLLVEVLRHPDFRAGRLSTHFIADHWPQGFEAPPVAPGLDAELALAATLWEAEGRRAAIPHVPALRAGWRNNPFRPQDARYEAPSGEVVIEYVSEAPGRYRVAASNALVTHRDDRSIELEVDGLRRRYVVVADGERRHVRGPRGSAVLSVVPRFPRVHAEAIGGGCTSPMPGKVVKVLVEPGQKVTAGEPLVVLEAMKMEQTLTAPADGIVAAVRCAVGDFVQPGVLLVELAE